jgi:hypothetical protein
LTLGGALIYDTVLGRLTDPRGPRKLIAISNRSALRTGTTAASSTTGRATRACGTSTSDVDNPHLPDDYVAEMLETKETRPHCAAARLCMRLTTEA